jgi:hypothetical protein
LIKEANRLLEDTREANRRFLADIKSLIDGVKDKLMEAGKEVDRLDREFAQLEREAVDKIDEAMLDFIAEDEEEIEE